MPKNINVTFMCDFCGAEEVNPPTPYPAGWWRKDACPECKDKLLVPMTAVEALMVQRALTEVLGISLMSDNAREALGRVHRAIADARGAP